ncbi:MAG: 7-carboxy-7-deazaguanine synthase [Holophagaceae bacterium]|nr:7-carboxy-7-deazaguanine synthase [Holophagaceae bacterium]
MATRRPKEIALYRIKEIFYSLQGEGFNAGRAAVFIRFSGCNLWSGLERDRYSALCQFCDTDFFGMDGLHGGYYSSADLADAVLAQWVASEPPFVVCTGGEPLLQLDSHLTAALRAKGCTVALETNGTMPVVSGLDWITVSPKAGTELLQSWGNEIKLLYPQHELDPSQYESYDFGHFYLQPIDDKKKYPDSIALAIEYCMKHPKWKLSLQTQKLVGFR